MSTMELASFVAKATEMFRKGEAVTTKGNVTEIYAMPHVDELRTTSVDVHFMIIGFTEAAANKDEFIRLIRESSIGDYATVDIPRLMAGPSYIELGAWLGSQDLALCFMALGEHYDLWTVITPAKLHITDPAQADEFAGGGFVLIAPKPGLRAVLEGTNAAT